MRIAVAALVTLFPVFALASATLPKDKYVDCNCHVTPALSSLHEGTATTEHKVVHHHHKAVKKAEATPPANPPKHKAHKKVVAKKDGMLIVGNSYPGHDAIISSNKLALPAGKSSYSPGQIVYISGRVLDAKCVPVSDAVVEIWQADENGHYVRSTLGERLSPAPVFTGNGRATTDNLGRFNFVTVFPGTADGRAPLIHVRVSHTNFSGLDTAMFFGDDTRNGTDPLYSRLNAQERKMLTAKVWQRDVNDPKKGLGASWDISLDWKNPWRHF